MRSYNSKIADKKNVEFILFSKDSDAKAALSWAKKEKFPWAHVLPKKHTSSGLKKYDKPFVPYYVLIDKEGKVLAKGKEKVFAKVGAL